MADEKSTGRGRRGRRRYFQPRKDKSTAPGTGTEAPRPSEDRPATTRVRKARRRARSRQRYSDETRSPSIEPDVAYVAPTAVYVYEHTVHPELRDAYEFRPEHFSKIGRKLDDYEIDLSKLFPAGEVNEDGTPVLINMLPTPEFNWEGWEEESKEKG